VTLWYLSKFGFKIYVLYLATEKLFDKMDMPLEDTKLHKKTVNAANNFWQQEDFTKWRSHLND